MKKIRKGFTLIEMVIVLFIISLLLLIMIPNLVQQKDHADKQSTEAFKTTLVTQSGLYLENNPAKTEEKVTIGDLRAGKYITASQAKKAEKLQIGVNDNILDKIKDDTTINTDGDTDPARPEDDSKN